MAAYGTPEKSSSDSYASPQGKAERIAMRSSFAVGVSPFNIDL